jgi:hypothetical protein
MRISVWRYQIINAKRDRKPEGQGHRYFYAGQFVHILRMVFKFTQLSTLHDTGFTDNLPNMGILNTSGPKQNLQVCCIHFVQR